MPELADAVADVPFWWHSIDLGEGVVTPGHKPVDHEAEWRSLRLPDLRGRSVLDIGAWDGYYSFAAERAGAARVVALDYDVWAIDYPVAMKVLPDEGPSVPPETVPEVWRPDTLPGKRGFDLAHRALDSRVESVFGDFMTVDLDELGRFDVVLFLGVLYHLRHPLLALERLVRVTGELAAIETDAVLREGLDGQPWCLFVEDRDVNGDPSNWWIPTAEAAAALGRAAGFTRVDVVSDPPTRVSQRYRAVLHAVP